jgi:hypothetical protein
MRLQSHCCKVSKPTNTGSAGVKRCLAWRYRARCQASSWLVTRTSRAGSRHARHRLVRWRCRVARDSTGGGTRGRRGLDWSHIAMRWRHVQQLATGAIRQGQTAETRTWLLDRIKRAKWALWNGQFLKTRWRLSELRVWTWNARANPSWLEHLRSHLTDLTCHLEANADSLPN